MDAIYFGEQLHDLEKVYGERVRERIGRHFQIPPAFFSKKDLGKIDFSNATCLFSTWGMPALSEEEIKRYFPALTHVFYAAGSVQAFARPFLRCGVKVCSGWKANAVPVVEYTVAQILLAGKGFYALSQMAKKDYAAAIAYKDNFKGNFNTHVGILGDGAIGGEVIRRLKRDYVYDVSVYSITMTEEEAKERGVRLASLDEIFGTCDIISNHLANNAQTKKMIDRRLLQKMKPFTTLVNTGRGAQIDEEALIDVLEKDQTITAVLDVTDPEPPVKSSKLYTLPNVVLTPHIAGSSGNEVRRMAEYMAEEAERMLAGEPLRYEVTEEMLGFMA